MIPQTFSPDDLLNQVNQQNTTQIDLGTGFLFDFEKGEFVIRNGRLVELNDIEAVKMWITKIIKTEKFEYQIYDNYQDTPEYQYGTLTEFVIGNIFTDDIKVQLQENIELSATRHPRVAFLDQWDFQTEDDSLTVSFRVNLVDNTSFSMGVNV